MLTRVTSIVTGDTLAPAIEQTWVVSACNEMKTPLGTLKGDQPYRKERRRPLHHRCRRACPRRCCLSTYRPPLPHWGLRVLGRRLRTAGVAEEGRREPWRRAAPSRSCRCPSVGKTRSAAPCSSMKSRRRMHSTEKGSVSTSTKPRRRTSPAGASRIRTRSSPAGTTSPTRSGSGCVGSGGPSSHRVRSIRGQPGQELSFADVQPGLPKDDRFRSSSRGTRRLWRASLPTDRSRSSFRRRAWWFASSSGRNTSSVGFASKRSEWISKSAQVFIGYRYPFRYVFIPEQLRICTLALEGT